MVEQSARAIARRLCLLQFCKLSLEFLKHREMHVAIELDKIGKQDERPLNALDQCQT